MPKSIIWELGSGDLFRIDGNWYRLQRVEGENAVLSVVGTKDVVKMSLATEVSEISVLSKK